jgi:DNA polymerase-3 subunit epsilon
MTKILICDCETGGLDPQEHSILSLAAVCWENREIIDEFEILIREPVVKVTPEAIRINRIDLNKLCEEGVQAHHAVHSFRAFTLKHFPHGLKGSTKVFLGGHNVSFDIGFIRRLWSFRTSEPCYENIFSHRTLDTCSILRFLSLSGGYSGLVSSGLTDACKYFNIPITDAERHTALGDARATAQLLSAVMDHIKIPG